MESDVVKLYRPCVAKPLGQKKSPLEWSCAHVTRVHSQIVTLWTTAGQVFHCVSTGPSHSVGWGLVANRTPHMFWVLLLPLSFNLDVSKHHSLEYYRLSQVNSAWHSTEQLPQIERDTDLPHTCIPYLATQKTIELRATPNLWSQGNSTACVLLNNHWV